MPHRFALLFCLALAACAEMPDLALPAAPASGAAPRILPLDDLVAQARLDPPGTAVAAPAPLMGRAAALRARAAAMRGPVNDPATRARLAAAIDARG